MSTLSSDPTVALFKKVYGQINKAVPKYFVLSREIPFQQSALVGASYIEAVVLSGETGWTLLGTDMNNIDLNTSSSSNVRQAEIVPSVVVLRSLIPVTFMTRSANGGEEAFLKGTSYIMESHMESHDRLLEVIRHNGQSPYLLGRVSYAPNATVYRGATYSGNGTVTLTKSDGTTLAFTAGVNTASKAILFQPGDFAPGFWVGNDGAQVRQVDTNGAVVASGKLVSVDSSLGFITVDFTPVAASAIGSHRICFQGQELALDAVGMHKILTNASTLFGVNAAQFSLWKTPSINCGGKRFNLEAVLAGVSQAVNAGGLDKPLVILVGVDTFQKMIKDEAALRRHDAKYSSSKAENGFESIEIYGQNGVNMIVADRFMMEGLAMGIVKEDWLRGGSSEVSFQPRGTGGREMIKLLDEKHAYDIRSHSDQFLLCRRPARQILWTNINWESTSAYGA
jgi:hypothetical protein